MGTAMTQTEWDRLLVTCFYSHLDVQMWRIVGELTGIKGLRRIPKKFHLKMTVARFVSGHIPRLGSVLWDRSAKDIERIVAALAKSRLDTLDQDPKTKRESVARRAQKRLMAANTLSTMGARTNNLKSGGHCWNVCK